MKGLAIRGLTKLVSSDYNLDSSQINSIIELLMNHWQCHQFEGLLGLCELINSKKFIIHEGISGRSENSPVNEKLRKQMCQFISSKKSLGEHIFQKSLLNVFTKRQEILNELNQAAAVISNSSNNGGSDEIIHDNSIEVCYLQ